MQRFENCSCAQSCAQFYSLSTVPDTTVSAARVVVSVKEWLSIRFARGETLLVEPLDIAPATEVAHAFHRFLARR